MECNHGITFDADSCKGLSAAEIRKKFPRFYGVCTKCGYNGIYYVSYEHFHAGDW